MRAGRMDRRITLLRRDSERNDSGQKVPQWAMLDEVWAEWAPLRGTERWTAMQHVQTAEGAYKIRWRDDLQAVDAIEDESGNRYEIIGVPEEIGRREGLKIHVHRRFGDGP